MAKVQLSALLTSLTGKIGGSVFQNSYGGLQMRTRVSPRNPQSLYQQQIRMLFAIISYRWRDLPSDFQLEWIEATGQPTSGNQLFQGCNINALLIGLEGIAEWTDLPAPGTMEFAILEADSSSLIVQAQGAITTVPADTRLLVEISPLQPSSRYFNSDDSFAPIIWYEEGTDMSGSNEIITDYNDRFGSLNDNRTLTIRFVLISKINGLRGIQYRQQVVTPVV